MDSILESIESFSNEKKTAFSEIFKKMRSHPKSCVIHAELSS